MNEDGDDKYWWKLSYLTSKWSKNENPEKSRNFFLNPGIKNIRKSRPEKSRDPGIWQNPVPKNPGIEILDPVRAWWQLDAASLGERWNPPLTQKHLEVAPQLHTRCSAASLATPNSFFSVARWRRWRRGRVIGRAGDLLHKLEHTTQHIFPPQAANAADGIPIGCITICVCALLRSASHQPTTKLHLEIKSNTFLRVKGWRCAHRSRIQDPRWKICPRKRIICLIGPLSKVQPVWQEKLNIR